MTYPFTDRAAEDERLIAQGCLFDPLTRRVLLAAGLSPGNHSCVIGPPMTGAWAAVPSGPGE